MVATDRHQHDHESADDQLDHQSADELLADFMTHYAWRKPFCGPVTLVYRVINRYSRLPDGARPAVETIAADAGVSPRTVKRARRTLVALGLLEVVPRFDEAGRPMPNLYRPLPVPETKAQVVGRVKFGSGIGTYLEDPVVDQEVVPDQDPEVVVDPDLSLLEPHHHSISHQSPVIQALGFAQCSAGQEPQGVWEPGRQRPNILVALHQVTRLVEAFESHVDRVGPVRRRKFWHTAYRMLIEDRLAVDEVLAVVEHSFAHEHRLACELDADEDVFMTSTGDIKLTRLDQIRVVYPEIRADMERHRHLTGGVWVHPEDDEQLTPPLDPAGSPLAAAFCGGGTLTATLTIVRPTTQEGCRP